jgi:hypothetical protein
MAGPPTDIPKSELFLKLIESPRPSEVVDFPRKGADGKYIGKMRLFVLHKHELTRARVVAVKRVIEKYKLDGSLHDSRGVRDILSDEIICEILSEACRDEHPYNDDDKAPKYRKVFYSGDDLNYLTADEIATSYAAYVMIQERYGPHEGNLMSMAQITAWVKTLEEGARGFPLSHLSSLQRVTLTTSLARRVSVLSGILESHLKLLPESLVSQLESLGIGIGLFGKRAARSADEPPTDDLFAKLRDLTVDELAALIADETGEEVIREEITIDSAMSFKEAMSGQEYEDPED